jgi:hypothetical protein
MCWVLTHGALHKNGKLTEMDHAPKKLLAHLVHFSSMVDKEVFPVKPWVEPLKEDPVVVQQPAGDDSACNAAEQAGEVASGSAEADPPLYKPLVVDANDTATYLRLVAENNQTVQDVATQYNKQRSDCPGCYSRLLAEQLLAWNRSVHPGLTLTSRLRAGTDLLTEIRDDGTWAPLLTGGPSSASASAGSNGQTGNGNGSSAVKSEPAKVEDAAGDGLGGAGEAAEKAALAGQDEDAVAAEGRKAGQHLSSLQCRLPRPDAKHATLPRLCLPHELVQRLAVHTWLAQAQIVLAATAARKKAQAISAEHEAELAKLERRVVSLYTVFRNALCAVFLTSFCWRFHMRSKRRPVSRCSWTVRAKELRRISRLACASTSRSCRTRCILTGPGECLTHSFKCFPSSPHFNRPRDSVHKPVSDPDNDDVRLTPSVSGSVFSNTMLHHRRFNRAVGCPPPPLPRRIPA